MIRSILEALAGHLATEHIPVGIGDMTGTRPPFVSLWGPPAGREPDAGLGRCGEYSAVVGFTATAHTTALALQIADETIQRLTPKHAPSSFAIDGGRFSVAFVSAQSAQIDRGVTLPGSNTHPAYVTAQFRIHFQPTKEV